MTELMMFGYPARLVLELPDGPHDVTSCIELITTPEMRADPGRTGFWVSSARLLDEIEVEKRTRRRVQERPK